VVRPLERDVKQFVSLVLYGCKHSSQILSKELEFRVKPKQNYNTLIHFILVKKVKLSLFIS
jgi:hypothetical protein